MPLLEDALKNHTPKAINPTSNNIAVKTNKNPNIAANDHP